MKTNSLTVVTAKLSPAMRRYLIIGVSVYGIELLVIFGCQHLGMTPTQAVGTAFWVGLLCSFALQKVITFGDTRAHPRILARQVFLFSLLVLWNFGFTLLCTRLLQDILPAQVIRTLALEVTTVWNFYLYRTRIFQAP